MYIIQIRRKALKEIKVLPISHKPKIITAIDELANNPRPSGCKKLKSDEQLYRIRIGEYRVVYNIEDKVQIVEVTKVGHRKDIYRSL